MKKLVITTLVTGLAVLTVARPVAAAGPASLSLTPTSGSRTVGSSLVVSVVENGDAVNVVTANLTYDATKLTCTGVSGGAAFPNQVVGSCGGGSVTISRYTNPGTTVSGSQTIASVSFTAVAAGSASISTAAGSQIASASNNIWNGVISSASFAITVPTTPTQPTNPTNPTTPTQPTTPSGPSAPAGQTNGGSTTAVTTTTNNGTKVTTVKNADGSTTTTSVAQNGETTVVTKTADGKVTVKKTTSNERKKRGWWMFGVVEGNGPLTGARYGSLGLVALASIGGLIYLGYKRQWFKLPRTTATAKSVGKGVKAAPRAVATAVKPLPSKVKRLAKRG